MRLTRVLLWTVAVVFVPGVAGYLFMHAMQRPVAPVGRSHAPTLPAAESAPAAFSKRIVFPVTWETLVADLSHDDTRAAAVEFLRAAHYRERDKIARLRNEAANPAARSLLTARLREIYAQLAAGPPPISLHVSKATLAEVVDALNREMGTHMRGPPGTMASSGVFTLDVDNKPFWEVVVLLQKQWNFILSPWAEVSFSMSDRIVHHAISGPYLFQVRTLPTSGVTQPPSFMLVSTAIADPRLEVASAGLAILYGPDSNGNALRNMNGMPTDVMQNPHPLRSGAGAGYSVQPYLLENGGQRLSWVKGKAVFTIRVPQEVAVVRTQEALNHSKVQVGDVSVSLTDESGGQWSSILCKVSPPASAAEIAVTLLEAGGDTKWSLTPDAGNKDGEYRGSLKPMPPGPYEMRVALGRQTREETVEFEVKDVPVPGK